MDVGCPKARSDLGCMDVGCPGVQLLEKDLDYMDVGCQHGRRLLQYSRRLLREPQRRLGQWKQPSLAITSFVFLGFDSESDSYLLSKGFYFLPTK